MGRIGGGFLGLVLGTWALLLTGGGCNTDTSRSSDPPPPADEGAPDAIAPGTVLYQDRLEFGWDQRFTSVDRRADGSIVAAGTYRYAVGDITASDPSLRPFWGEYVDGSWQTRSIRPFSSFDELPEVDVFEPPIAPHIASLEGGDVALAVAQPSGGTLIERPLTSSNAGWVRTFDFALGDVAGADEALYVWGLDEETGVFHLVRLHAADGREVWRRELAAEYSDGFVAETCISPNTVAASADGSVTVAGSRFGTLRTGDLSSSDRDGFVFVARFTAEGEPTWVFPASTQSPRVFATTVLTLPEQLSLGVTPDARATVIADGHGIQRLDGQGHRTHRLHFGTDFLPDVGVDDRGHS